MTTSLPYLILVIVCVALLAFCVRLLPFIFSAPLKNSVILASIGKYLPPYIMFLLAIFEIGLDKFTKAPYNIPAVLGLLAVVAVHWRWRKTLVSILVSAIVYALSAYLLSLG